MNRRQQPINFWRKIYARLHQHRAFRWAKSWLIFLLFLAIFGDFLANNIPLYCRDSGRIQFPIFQRMVGVGTYTDMTDWQGEQFTFKVYPIIPYSAQSFDSDNTRFVSPFGQQKIKSIRYRHWLGTDQLGRDVLAGLIGGARISLIVSFLGVGLAGLIGVLLGLLAGYFGDYGFKMPVGRIFVSLLIFLVFVWLLYALPIYLGTRGLWLFVCLVLWFFCCQYLVGRLPFGKKAVSLPLDRFLLRGVEIFTTIPGLLLILVLGSIFPKSEWTMALLIGLSFWPTIARFTRGEMLKVREKEYIQLARMQGIPSWRIILRHALPNATGPTMTVVMLGLGNAILAEALLSFLGIGLPADAVSWGKLLAVSRTNISAWWLTVFPGLFIFLTILSANRIGEILQEELRSD